MCARFQVPTLTIGAISMSSCALTTMLFLRSPLICAAVQLLSLCETFIYFAPVCEQRRRRGSRRSPSAACTDHRCWSSPPSPAAACTRSKTARLLLLPHRCTALRTVYPLAASAHSVHWQTLSSFTRRVPLAPSRMTRPRWRQHPCATQHAPGTHSRQDTVVDRSAIM